VVIKNAAASVNPVDWKVQHYGVIFQKYPNILGIDVAGEVVEIGEGVKDLKKGQRVIGHCVGLATDDPKHGGFQLYTVCKDLLVSPIPDSLSFEKAVVLPLAISTASVGLFKKDRLGLPYPTNASKPTGKIILVWGGSSSVGSLAIQLAAAAGVTVVTVASSHNLQYVKSLGAKHAFDYKSPSVVDDIVSVVKGTDFAGVFDAISTAESTKIWNRVFQKLGSGGKYALTLPEPEGILKDMTGGGVVALTLVDQDQDIGEAVWKKFVPEALANGKLQAKPDPLVITGGLSKVQEGLDRLKQGVSAGKVVIKL